MKKQRRRIFKIQFKRNFLNALLVKCKLGKFPSYTDKTDKSKLLPMVGVEIYKSSWPPIK